MINTFFPIALILALSIIIQIVAAIMAFRLIGITGRRTAWSLIAVALTLMAVRRMVPFFRLIAGDSSLPPDLLNEVIGLALSAAMAAGIARIAPLFIERKKREDVLAEQIKLAELSADIGHALVKQGDIQIILNTCTEALVLRLEIAFACIWVLNTTENILEIQASSGLCSRKNRFRNHEGNEKFGVEQIAEERKPYITNVVIGDPRIRNQEWAVKEGLVAFAGYPLIIENKLIGVMEMYSQRPLIGATHKALETIANEIAIGIERKLADEEIQKLNRDLEMRVNQRTAQLTAANKELEAFAYSIAHDLRTPLRGIDGFSQFLLTEYRNKVDLQGKKYLQRIRSAAQYMAQLIDDILDLSKISRGEMNFQIINLSYIVKEIADELHDSQPKRKVEFIIREGVVVLGDSKLLRIVFENLIGNAWKFTSKHPTSKIEFGVQQQNNKTAYFVRDDGAGFDMKYSQKLFGTFQRLHTNKEFPGTGIGLAKVQRIISRHGGIVLAEGEVEKGATFYFTIP